ncbi:MAG: hypothetical protein PUI58_04115, partial [Solobacterium sp.]|nr:hypothetical protein [Solobacterium sp.]
KIKELIDININDSDCKCMTICLYKTTISEESKFNSGKLWEGDLPDIPEKFYTCNITDISQHLSEIQNGLTKFHVEID